MLLLNWMCNELSEGSAACRGVMGREERERGQEGSNSQEKVPVHQILLINFVVTLVDEEHFL